MINKKGQIGVFFTFMVAIVMFILGFSLASPLVASSNVVRGAMDCNNASIDNFQKATCLVVDVSVPFVVGIIFALGGLAIGAKLGGYG